MQSRPNLTPRWGCRLSSVAPAGAAAATVAAVATPAAPRLLRDRNVRRSTADAALSEIPAARRVVGDPRLLGETLGLSFPVDAEAVARQMLG